MKQSKMAWVEWENIQRTVAHSLISGQKNLAMSVVDEFLVSTNDRKIKSEVLAFRGGLNARFGRTSEAIQDFLAARKHDRSPSYSRYTLEVGLGNAYSKLGNLDDATYWYLTALRTSEQDHSTSGGSALWRFLNSPVAQEKKAEHAALCNAVAIKSWKLLNLPGSPDLENLVATAQMILEAQRKQPSPPA